MNTITGLYSKFYQPDYHYFCNQENFINESFFDISSSFWNYLFSKKVIEKVLFDASLLKSNDDYEIKLLAIIRSPNQFMFQIDKSLKNICDLNTTSQGMFSAIETLNMYCYLYSLLYTQPFKLSIDEGFHRSNDSSKEMYMNSLLLYSNPYLNFLNDRIIPVLYDINPDILWIEGRPNIVSFAIARLLKLNNKNIHISATYHSSEYYSLNKIQKYLSKNEYLFKCYDSIILGNNTENIKLQIRTAILNNISLETVPNIMYVEDGIINTSYSVIENLYNGITFRSKDKSSSYKISPCEIVDIKLFPNNSCYWRKCTFCGINNKYSNTCSNFWDINLALNQLEILKENKTHYFWSIDEAIPPKVLEELAMQIIKEDYKFIWHTRSRIEYEWTDIELAKLLASAGLKQIRLGFESASIRILKLMKKHENPEKILGIVEQVISNLTSQGIHTHFPSIIGFPCETSLERNETLIFLHKMRCKYPLFTYNINILDLDVSSNLFLVWDKYNIQSIDCIYPLNEYLSNTVAWFEPITGAKSNEISMQRYNYMKKLYPWYPNLHITEPHIFYRIIESTRHTMFVQHNEKEPTPIKGSIISCSESNVFFKTEKGSNIIYNYDSHHYIECSESLYDFLIGNNTIEIDTINKELNKFINQLISSKFYQINLNDTKIKPKSIELM